MTTTIEIEVWSDVVCPYCFLGKKKLEQTINKLGVEDQVIVVWRSFQLNPSMSTSSSLPTLDYLIYEKGYAADQVKSMCDQLTQVGKNYSINFDFKSALTFNTFDAHRLIQWAKTLNKADQLKEGFMKAHFSEGIDLSNQKNLITIVEQQGLDSEKATEILNSEAFALEVTRDLNKSNALGITGVPYFLINGKQVISGAQSDDVFEQTISKVLKEVNH